MIKCPLKVNAGDTQVYTGECCKALCAWWNTRKEMCAIAAIADYIDDIELDIRPKEGV